MTKDEKATLLVGGLAALGLLAVASSTSGSERRRFHDTLEAELRPHGLRLVGAELGRLRGRPVWVVTCEGRDRVLHRLQVPVTDPAYESVHAVAEQVVSTLAAA